METIEQKAMMKDFKEIGLRLEWKLQSVGDDSIEADGTNKGEELQERNLFEEQQVILFRIKGSTEEQDKRSIGIIEGM